jgi:hypothetical protein
VGADLSGEEKVVGVGERERRTAQHEFCGEARREEEETDSERERCGRRSRTRRMSGDEDGREQTSRANASGGG